MAQTVSSVLETTCDEQRMLLRYFRVHQDYASMESSLFVISEDDGPATAILTMISPHEARELAELFTLIADQYN